MTDADDRVKLRNFTHFRVRGSGRTSRREAGDIVALRWRPGDVFESSWPGADLGGAGLGEKVWGKGAGFLTYRIRIPDAIALERILGGTLLLEVAASAGREKVTWPRYKPVDYPQTDGIKSPTDVEVFLGTARVVGFTVPDDPADYRGLLSHVAGFHPGSYGYRKEIPLTRDVLMQGLQGGRVLAIRLEVPAKARNPGGLAVFGERRGRYPMDPTLQLDLSEDVGEGGLGPANLPVVEGGGARQVLATAEETGEAWRFTTRDPGPTWPLPDHDDAAWSRGRGGFGRRTTPGSRVNTDWDTEKIWLRKAFTLGERPRKAALRIHHDEDVRVYLNGTLIFERRGYLTRYRVFALPKKALEAIKTGRNLLAVSCLQTGGGQYIDVGLILK